MRVKLKFYRLSAATLYDCINTIHQFIKHFFDKKCLFLRNMEPLRSMLNKNFLIPKSHTNSFINSFSSYRALVWNSIPLSIKNTNTLDAFTNVCVNGCSMKIQLNFD